MRMDWIGGVRKRPSVNGLCIAEVLNWRRFVCTAVNEDFRADVGRFSSFMFFCFFLLLPSLPPRLCAVWKESADVL